MSEYVSQKDAQSLLNQLNSTIKIPLKKLGTTRWRHSAKQWPSDGPGIVRIGYHKNRCLGAFAILGLEHLITALFWAVASWPGFSSKTTSPRRPAGRLAGETV